MTALSHTKSHKKLWSNYVYNYGTDRSRSRWRRSIVLLRLGSIAWRRAGRKSKRKNSDEKRLNKQLALSKLQTAHVSMTAAREGRSWRASEATPNRGLGCAPYINFCQSKIDIKRRPEVKFHLLRYCARSNRRPHEVQHVKTPSLPSWANVSMYLCIYRVFEVGHLFQTIEMKVVYLFYP